MTFPLFADSLLLLLSWQSSPRPHWRDWTGELKQFMASLESQAPAAVSCHTGLARMPAFCFAPQMIFPVIHLDGFNVGRWICVPSCIWSPCGSLLTSVWPQPPVYHHPAHLLQRSPSILSVSLPLCHVICTPQWDKCSALPHKLQQWHAIPTSQSIDITYIYLCQQQQGHRGGQGTPLDLH